jgi:hypothetical protein
MLTSRIFACAAVSVSLVACGGSDSPAPAPAPAPAPTPAPVPAPSGLYQGTSSNTSLPEIQLLALENGIMWGIYGRTVNGTFLVAGVLNSNGAANNGSYAATDLRDYFYTGMTYAGTVSASYTAAGTWNGTAIFPTSTVSFTTQKVSSSSYNYDTQAQLSAIAGSWSGTDLSGDPATVVISSTGAVSGNAQGCLFTGTAAPRPTGKNVFDVTITFANSQLCSLPGGSASGIGVTYPIAGTTRSQFLVAVQTPNRTLGDAFIAIR